MNTTRPDRPLAPCMVMTRTRGGYLRTGGAGVVDRGERAAREYAGGEAVVEDSAEVQVVLEERVADLVAGADRHARTQPQDGAVGHVIVAVADDPGQGEDEPARIRVEKPFLAGVFSRDLGRLQLVDQGPAESALVAQEDQYFAGVHPGVDEEPAGCGYGLRLGARVPEPPSVHAAGDGRAGGGVERYVHLRDPVRPRVGGDERHAGGQDRGGAPEAVGKLVLARAGVLGGKSLDARRGRKAKRVNTLVVVTRDEHDGTLLDDELYEAEVVGVEILKLVHDQVPQVEELNRVEEPGFHVRHALADNLSRQHAGVDL